MQKPQGSEGEKPLIFLPYTGGALSRAAVACRLLLVVALVAACTAEDRTASSLPEVLGRGDPSDPTSVFEAKATWTERVEELVVECMAEQGFDYLPRSVAPDPRADGSMTDEEYRRRYGYGMVHTSDPTLEDADAAWGDPNERLRASMDMSTLLAWQIALAGEDPIDHESRDGCRAASEDAVNAHLFTDVWAELEPRLDELEDRIAADPRTIAAEARWSECMAEAGWPFRDEEEAITYLQEAIFDAWENEPHPVTGTYTTYRWSIAPWFVETETWADLWQMELAIVAAADSCMEDPEVREEYEQQFLEDNADLLHRLQELL